MKKTGPKNRGSHPDGLPLTRSGLYNSCAYLLEAFRNSVARSRCFPAVRQQIFRREHMAERYLLFHDTMAPHLAAYAPEANAAQQRDFLTHLNQTLNVPSHAIRKRLDRIVSDSPDLLAVIKQKGKV